MYGVKMFKGFVLKTFAKKNAAKKLEQTVNAAGTKVRTGLNGGVYMERVFKGQLYKTEIEVLENGVKKTRTRVYDGEGKYIGKGGNEGLAAFRETEIKRTKGGSILGGDKVEINKTYHETMGMTKYNINLTKEYDANGVLQHMEGAKKYRHWTEPQKAVIDKVWVEEALPHSAELMFNPKNAVHTKYKHKISDFKINNRYNFGYSNYSQFANEETTYTKAIQNLKTAAAEKETARIAETKAKQQAIEALKTTQPRVNVGKVFNKNIEEFKCVESTKADGSIVRRYYEPKTFVSGKSNPMITTIDKGNYHEELIYDPIKGIKISYKQLGKNEPDIEMSEGMRYSYSSKMKTFDDGYGHIENRRVNTQVYDDGLNQVEFYSAGYPEKFKLNVKKPYNKNGCFNDSTIPDNVCVRGRGAVIQGYDYYYGQEPFENTAQGKLNEISKEAKERWKDLMDLFKPYQP